MKKIMILLAGMTSLSFAIPGINVDISAGYMRQDPSGNIRYQGDSIDIENDLGLGAENKPFLRAKLEIPIVPNLYVQYVPMEFTGRKQNTVTYGGRQLSGQLDTTVKLDRYDIGLYYNIPVGTLVSLGTLGMLSVDPEIGINIRVLNFEGSITGEVAGERETVSKTLTFPVPMAYGGLGIKVGRVKLLGEIRYISYQGSTYYDWIGEFRIKPVPFIYVGAGYREEKVKLEDVDDVYSDITIKGPYAVVGISF